jgi:hypothetical protein
LPNEIVIPGAVEEFATVPLTPFDGVTDTDVTEPVADVPDVGAQDALIAEEASSANVENEDERDVPEVSENEEVTEFPTVRFVGRIFLVPDAVPSIGMKSSALTKTAVVGI